MYRFSWKEEDEGRGSRVFRAKSKGYMKNGWYRQCCWYWVTGFWCPYRVDIEETHRQQRKSSLGHQRLVSTLMARPEKSKMENTTGSTRRFGFLIAGKTTQMTLPRMKRMKIYIVNNTKSKRFKIHFASCNLPEDSNTRAERFPTELLQNSMSKGAWSWLQSSYE